MIEINGGKLCENCFEPTTGGVCKSCGFNPEDNAPDTSLLAPGTVLINRYVIGRTIGKGGFGVTYLAYDALVGKKIAIKEYFPHQSAQRTTGSAEVSVASAESEEAFRKGAEKFYNEARLVSRFNGNPNIVGIYDSFYENSTAYMAMEYLEGCTLKDYIREHGVLSASKALFAAKSIASALIVAHSANVLHRDITPDNVILCKNGDIKLIDFGAARQVVTELSQNFTAILKPGFAPPEQYSKKGNQGPWTDVYAVGTTLYFMLTTDIPDDPSVRFDEDDTFKENTYDIDPALWEVIAKATKLKMNERYADAYELKKALDAVEIKPEPIIVPDEASNAEPQPEAAENISKMTVSIKPIKPKQSFFRKHLRTFVEITCGVLVAAIIIPLAVQVYKLSAAVTPDTSGGSLATVTIGDGVDLDKEGFDKPLYLCLSDSDKALYGRIYKGLCSSSENIALPPTAYTVSEVNDIFDDVISDNPELCHVQSFNIKYIESNHNSTPDDNETATSLQPVYIDLSPDELKKHIEQTLSETDMDEKDPIGMLRSVYDDLAKNTEYVARGATPASSTAYGALIERKADDVGLARALCCYAQSMGYPCIVTDTHLGNDMIMASVRTKIDGAWYSTFIVMGSSVNLELEEMPLAEGGEINHFTFLLSDFLASAGGVFTYIRDFDDKYESVFPKPEGIKNSNGEMIVPITNYYIEVYLGEKYYSTISLDKVYNDLCAKTKECLDNGADSAYLYIMPSDADGLWEKMQKDFVSDMKYKYDITISEYDVVYSEDRVIVTIKK